MLDKLLRIILIPPLLIMVSVLVIIGLLNFGLMADIVAKLIIVVIIVGVFAAIISKLFLLR